MTNLSSSWSRHPSSFSTFDKGSSKMLVNSCSILLHNFVIGLHSIIRCWNVWSGAVHNWQLLSSLYPKILRCLLPYRSPWVSLTWKDLILVLVVSVKGVEYRVVQLLSLRLYIGVIRLRNGCSSCLTLSSNILYISLHLILQIGIGRSSMKIISGFWASIEDAGVHLLPLYSLFLFLCWGS